MINLHYMHFTTTKKKGKKIRLEKSEAAEEVKIPNWPRFKLQSTY